MNILTIPSLDNEMLGLIASQGQEEERYNLSLLSPRERLKLLLFRDLKRSGWNHIISPKGDSELTPPVSYAKEVVRAAMAYSRNEQIQSNSKWISKHIVHAQRNLAFGRDVLQSRIQPRICVCSSQEENDLFRLYRYYWSSPSSDYVGRRIRLLIRDDGISGSPVIGIAALGSSIIHIPERDKWIGWDTSTRTKNIVYVMDAYVLGALPPYNYLLGGKLLSYILASNEVRTIYKQKYQNKETTTLHREASELALIMTTSLYGRHSAQYDRLSYGNSLLYQPIGLTSGFGSLHISSETFTTIREIAQNEGLILSNRFGDGPNWRMRLIRTVCEKLGLDSDAILKHSFQRGIFAVPLAENWRAFLNGKEDLLHSYDYPLNEMVSYWKTRWLDMRRRNEQVINSVNSFDPNSFKVEQSLTVGILD